ncbi:hypothetical protein T03_8026 [Trichinella britovi]|uniref:Uncharacterized protein n=1 Tax=Trichinella britovi TaxID=45882 RepID=A0A0V0Z5N6_TRIBR|nr:hypothetical protein T03_8026 [Trichinella britovi]
MIYVYKLSRTKGLPLGTQMYSKVSLIEGNNA